MAVRRVRAQGLLGGHRVLASQRPGSSRGRLRVGGGGGSDGGPTLPWFAERRSPSSVPGWG